MRFCVADKRAPSQFHLLIQIQTQQNSLKIFLTAKTIFVVKISFFRHKIQILNKFLNKGEMDQWTRTYGRGSLNANSVGIMVFYENLLSKYFSISLNRNEFYHF